MTSFYFDRFEVKVDGCDHKLIIKDAHLEDADEYTAQFNDNTSKAKLTVEGKQSCISELELPLIKLNSNII